MSWQPPHVPPGPPGLMGPPGPQRPSSPRDEKARRHLHAAQTLERSGDLRGAADEYSKAADLQPRNAGVLCRLGAILRMVDEPERARQVLERAAKIDPRHAETHVHLGMLRKFLREPERALESYERAAWAEPRDVRPHIGIFTIYDQMNRLDDAERAIRNALAIDPTHEHARLMLARLERRRGNLVAAVATVRELLARPIADDTRQRANFELGRCLDKRGEHDEAFKAFTTGNAIQSCSPQARAVDDRKWLKLIRDGHEFTAEHFERWAGEPPADGSPAPAFLFGFPRSGTTMTERILGAHPDVAVSDEHDLFSPMYRTLFPDWSDAEPLLPQLEAVPRERLAKGRAAYRREAERILRRTRGATVLVDKNPMNIVALGIVSRVFPDARVIVAVRDPRDVCLSCFFQEFVPNPSNNFFFTPEGTLEMYRMVMDLWLAQRDILRLRLLESRYETITADFENQARRLIGFLDLPWDDRVLEFHTGSTAQYVSTPSFEAVSSPVHTKARGKWRNYERHIGPLLEGLEPYVRALGYGE